ncbi:TPA: hypothetical protein N2901_004558 [Vibrio parahaemolyticus]|nr:hypothetical protein [Vibrio parahaemolyticus]
MKVEETEEKNHTGTLKNELQCLFQELNNIGGYFFRKNTSRDVGVIPLILEAVFLEIYERSLSDNINRKHLRALMEEAEKSLNKLPQGSAILEFPTEVYGDIRAKVKLTIKKGKEYKQLETTVNNVVRRYIDIPFDFSRLKAVLECKSENSDVVEVEVYSSESYKWSWKVKPVNRSGAIFLSVYIANADRFIPNSVREEYWPDFVRDKITIEVKKSLSSSFKDVLNNPWFITICGIILAAAFADDITRFFGWA